MTLRRSADTLERFAQKTPVEAVERIEVGTGVTGERRLRKQDDVGTPARGELDVTAYGPTVAGDVAGDRKLRCRYGQSGFDTSDHRRALRVASRTVILSAFAGSAIRSEVMDGGAGVRYGDSTRRPNEDQSMSKIRDLWSRWWRRLLLVSILSSTAGAGFLFFIDRHVGAAAAGRIHNDCGAISPRPVALVLGTSRLAASGRMNLFYQYRVEAAAKLYRDGKVRGLLVSGDNSRHDYNEPQEMKDDLVAAGVDPDHITLDYAGFRTLDSVIRARRIFGQDDVVVVTQRFHCERAIYLARAHGIDMVGYAARSPRGVFSTKVRLREVLARTKAWIDVHVLRKGPRFLGPQETVSLREV